MEPSSWNLWLNFKIEIDARKAKLLAGFKKCLQAGDVITVSTDRTIEEKVVKRVMFNF